MSNNRFIQTTKRNVFHQFEDEFKDEFINHINDNDWTVERYNDFLDEFVLEQTNTHEYSYQGYFIERELMPEYHSIIEYINESYNDMTGEDIGIDVVISTQKTFDNLLYFIGRDWFNEYQLTNEDDLEELIEEYRKEQEEDNEEERLAEIERLFAESDEEDNRERNP